MGSFANYLEKRLLDHLFCKDTYDSPTVYVALSTAEPGESGSGMAEPYAQNGYNRVVTSEDNWNDAADGSIDNATEISFPQATSNWGTATHFALLDKPFPNDWAASTAYSLGNFAKPVNENGYHYECTTAGTSGAAEPAWPTSPGQTVQDGTAVWTCRKYAGNLLVYGALSTSKTIGNGDTAKFAAGDLAVSLD
jgi:hypothetical protein